METELIDIGEWAAQAIGDREPEEPYRTLRLTLAMRGGVSLAVWIGGVVAELDLFRRACTFTETGDSLVTADEPIDRQERAKIYRGLLKAAGYERVEIDILAGASAGGLNAVLFGLAQSTRTVLDETVRSTWIEEGGIWELLHPGIDKKELPRALGFRRLASVLQGDTRLFKVAKRALEKLHGNEGPLKYPEPKGQPYNISVELAATLLDDIYRPGRGNRVGFSFLKTAATLKSNFTTIPVVGESEEKLSALALTRMALAARSTSSFPGAFEPARLRSTTFETSNDGLETNMSRVFPHARSSPDQATTGEGEDRTFDVVDGGIFDNIPIDRAIRAIRRAPSAAPTERRLVYIDPEPPSPPSQGGFNRGDPESALAWLPVILRSKALQKRSESSSDELGLLREHNDTVLRTQGRLEAVASTLSAENPATIVSAGAYIQYRIGLDTTRIGDLLTDPWSQLCQPPRPSDDYHALSAEDAVNIRFEVSRAYNGEPFPYPLKYDIFAILDQIRLLISWVRELERLVPMYGTNVENGIDVVTLNSNLRLWKRRLYRYSLAATHAKRLTVDAPLTEQLKTSVPLAVRRAYVLAVQGSGPGETTLSGAITTSLGKQFALSIRSNLLDELRAEVLPITDADLYEQLGFWPAENDVSPSLCGSFRGDLQNLRISIRDGTAYLAEAMLAIAPDVQIKWIRRWRESIYPHFYTAALPDDIAELAAVFAETGTPDTAALVEYREITSDLAPSLSASDGFDVEPLRKAARAKHMQKWLRHPPTQEQVNTIVEDPRSVMNADAKLSGNDLSRFGGFFLAKWRENDWQWGRLDAAAGIVRMLPRKAGEDDASPVDDRVRELQTHIMKGANATLEDDEDDSLPLRVGAETLESIHPSYRFDSAPGSGGVRIWRGSRVAINESCWTLGDLVLFGKCCRGVFLGDDGAEFVHGHIG